MNTDLHLRVGVEEHDAEEGQNLLGDLVVPRSQVRQRLLHGSRSVKQVLDVSDRLETSAGR